MKKKEAWQIMSEELRIATHLHFQDSEEEYSPSEIAKTILIILDGECLTAEEKLIVIREAIEHIPLSYINHTGAKP